MKLTERINVFSQLRERMDREVASNLDYLSNEASRDNSWFTADSIRQSIGAISHMLSDRKLSTWTEKYRLEPDVPKVVGIVMAGNIPLVGFHDLLCVLISGHFAAIKTSSQDNFLVTKVLEWLADIDPSTTRSFEIRDKLQNIDAVIATGSDNSARYFEYYFGKYPHIIRKNRTSIAVLNGQEDPADLIALGHDLYDYFGLGCRNVSKLFVPKDYDMGSLFDQWQDFGRLADHNKYKNNYDYQKSILLVNQVPHLDSGFSLLKEADELVSPISLNYYAYYDDILSVNDFTRANKEKIQCIVTSTPDIDGIPFGQSQLPELWDYADNIDTLDFLAKL